MKQKDVLERLRKKAEPSYAAFVMNLKSSDYPILGVRSAHLDKLATHLAKTEGIGHIDEFLQNEQPCYEEVILAYKTFGKLQDSKKEIIHSRLKALLTFNDGWATNDTLASNMKAFGKDRPFYWPMVKAYLASPNQWDIRFAVTAMMHWYLVDSYIDEVLDLLADIEGGPYYVDMAVAWALSLAFVSHRDKTLPYIRDLGNVSIKRKTIQKCIDSYRVSDKDKRLLASYRPVSTGSRHK